VAEAALLESLSAPQRLALAYAPRRARAAWLGFLVLDSRLAQIVRDAREPLLSQIRLAWWRERLQEPPDQRPRGEPLLAFLGDGGDALVPLVDGWEALLGLAPLPRDSFSEFARARGRALGGLAVSLGLPPREAEALARRWALADLATRVSHPDERDHVMALIAAEAPPPGILPRAMRPLVVLHGLAQRRLAGKTGIGVMMAALRLGIFGR
jgi:phytoene synthase